MTPVLLFSGLALLAGQATPPTHVDPLVVNPPAAEAQPDSQAVADNLADMYDKSCGGRLYGMYADACNGLAAQLRRAQEAARKARRATAAKP